MIPFLVLFPSVAVGLVVVLAVMVRWFLVPSDAKRTEAMLVTALLMQFPAGIAQAVANFCSKLRPLKYDLFAYRIDLLFGEPSFMLGRLVLDHPAVQIVLQLAYGLLPSAVLTVLLIELWFREPGFARTLRAFLLNLLLAPACYLLVPVCGPVFAFASFPHAPASFVPHPIPLSAPPNAIPSVHTSTALLVFWFSRRWRWGTLLGGAYLALIVLSTLASGQHYFIDLLLAVPYAAGVVQITARRPQPAAEPASNSAMAGSGS